MTDAPKKQVTELPLSSLLLDKDNPRFGSRGRTASQDEILDLIVEKFGIDDVLSSLAVNGYFAAEPMVCRRVEGSEQAVVAEGNRRLAACFILTGDERAKNQASRAQQYRPIWEEHGSKSIDSIPVILFDAHEQEQAILSYLGVRHIASTQPWDSYAKAAWVARVVEDSGLRVAEVARMIGDQHRTVSRLLQGYYFIRQLIDAGMFRPEDSIRRGRGSVTEYPFSWIYTILGYTSVRSFLQLNEDEIQKAPVKEEVLSRAALVTRVMFGDRSKGQSAAVGDSRELGGLAAAFANKEKIILLEQGKTLRDIEILTQPLVTRLGQGLLEVRDIQADLIARVSENELAADAAEEFMPLTGRNRKLAIELDKKITEAAHDGDDED